MANVVEILLVVRDLASGKLDSASRQMERNLVSIEKSAKGASTGLDSFSRSAEESARAGRDISTVARELEGAERALSRLGGAADGLPEELEKQVTALRNEKAALEALTPAERLHLTSVVAMERDYGRLTSSVARFVVGLGSATGVLRGSSRSMQDNDRDARRLAQGLHGVESGLAAVLTVGGLLPRVFSGLRNGFRDFIGGLHATEAEGKNLESRMGRLGFSIKTFADGLPLVNAGLLPMLGIIGAITAAVPLLSGVVVALSGAVTGLAASLGSLAAVAVALPAALGALGGIMAAVLTIIKPATDGILGAVQAAGKAQAAPAGSGGTSAAGGGDPVKQAEKNLATTRQVDALQVKRQERELAQARIDGVFRVRQAERDLASAREQAFTRLIDLEKQLIDLRTADDEKRAQLEQALAAAQAQQVADQARGGKHSALTGALVGEAQKDLTDFNKTAATQEGDLQQQIAQQRVDGIRSIRQAEDNLAQIRIDNVNHIRDLENTLKQTRIQNAQQEAAAQQAITQAQASAGGAAGAVQTYQNDLAHLAPIQQRIVQQVLDLKNRWSDLTAVFRDRFLQEVSRDIEAINGRLPVLAQLVGGFANVITNTLARVRQAFNDPTLFGAFQRDMQDAASNTDLFSRAGVLLGETMVFLVDAAKPLLDFISQTALALAQWAENAAKAGDQNGSLTAFFERVRDRLKVVLDILHHVLDALGNIAKAAAPFGDVLLGQIDTVAKHFDRFTSSLKGKNALKSFFQDSLPAARAVAGFFGSIVKGLAQIGRDFIRQPGQTAEQQASRGPASAARGDSPVTVIANTLTGAVPKLADAITNIATPSVVANLAKLVADLVALIDDLSRHTDGLSWGIKFLDALVRALQFIVDHGGPAGALLGNILTPLVVFAVLAPGLAAKAVTGIFKGFSKLNDLGGGEGGGFIGRVFGRAFRAGRIAVGAGIDLIERGLRVGSRGVTRAWGLLLDLPAKTGGGLKRAATTLGDISSGLAEKIGEKATKFKGAMQVAASAAADFGKKVLTTLANLGKMLYAMAVQGAQAAKRFAIWVFEVAIPAMLAYIAELVTATGAALGFDIAVDANVIAIIILAIIAFIAILVELVKHWDSVKKFLLDLWGKLKHAAGEAFGAIVDLIKNHWKDILAFFAGPLGWAYMLLKFTGLWDSLKSAVGDAWDWIKKEMRTAWGDIVDFFTNDAPGLLGKAFRGIFNFLGGLVHGALQDMISLFFAFFVDGPIKAINFVLQYVPIPGLKQIGEPHTPQLPAFSIESKDEGGVVKGQPGQRTGEPTLVMAHVGETFIPTHKRGGALGAIGGIFGSVAGGVGDAFGAAGGFLLHQLERIFPSLPKMPGIIGKAAVGTLSLIKDKVLSWGKDKLGALASAIFGGGTGGQVAPLMLHSLLLSKVIDEHDRFAGINWGTAPYSAALTNHPSPPWNRRLSPAQANVVANAALRVANALTQSNLNALLGRAFQESGYQSAIVNDWDSNWQAGIPSVGFLQTIGPTFFSHALKPFTNIWDPLHNAISAVRYMLANYHHIVGPSGSGYWTGGIIGSGRPGMASASARPGAPMPVLAHVGEWILNNQQIGRLAAALGGMQRAEKIVFGGQVPVHTGSFAAGGMVGWKGTAGAGGGDRVVNIGPINTASPKIDIDYISRIAEQRLLQGA